MLIASSVAISVNWRTLLAVRAATFERRVLSDTLADLLKVLCSYQVTAICKFALLMYMSEFCCCVLLIF